MKTTIQEKDGCMVAILEGSLNTAEAPETEKAMAPLFDVEGKDIILKKKVSMCTFRVSTTMSAPSLPSPASAISSSSNKRRLN